MGSRGRRWSVASVGLPADISAIITSPIIACFSSSWPNTPEYEDSVFDYRRQISVGPKTKTRSNSIGELFSGSSWIRSNSTNEESLRFKPPRFSFSKFQGIPKNVYKGGIGIVTLLNGNTILIYSQFGSELNNSLIRAQTDLKISTYYFLSASVQIAQMLDLSKNVIGSTLERIIEQHFEDETSNEKEAKKEICQDLLINENIYQKSLKNLHHIYVEPIRRFSYLNQEEHEKLFSGIESLISLSSALVSRLEFTLSNWDPSNSNIGCIFSSKIWTDYNEYYCRYPQIKKILEQKLQEECPFTEFCQENQISSGLSLEHLLSLPCQQIPEYEQSLSRLLEKTEENQPDYQNLKLAIDQIKKIVCGCYKNGTGQSENNNNYSNTFIQDGKDEITENVQRRKSTPGAILFRNLGSAKKRISGDKGLDPEIVNFARYQSNIRRLFIMEHAVQLTNCVKTYDRYLFLFDDVLLVAKKKSDNQFKLKHYVCICEMWLATSLDEISEQNHVKEKSFVIGWPTLSIVATFASKELKEEWQTRLKQLIDEKKEQEEPKEISISIHFPDQKQEIMMQVQNTTLVKEVVKKCLDKFQMSKVDIDDYELRTEYGDNESTPYLLMGHEIPYNIKMNHIRNSSENKDVCDNNNETKTKFDFLLMVSKKTPKKNNTDEIDWKGVKKKLHQFNLFKKTTKLEEKPLKRLFAQPHKDVIDNDCPPKPIDDLLQLLFKKGPTIKGIFRTPASAKKKRELCEMLENAEAINMEDVTGNLAAAVLMEYLRSIPHGLLMEHKYADWIEAGRLLNDTEKLTKIQSLVCDLPPFNQRLLQQLMCVFYYINKKSLENLMSAQNLATCIAPSLLGSKSTWLPEDQADLMLITDLISYMIENYVQIFGADVVSLFRSMPSERVLEDSDTDSFHSTLSTQETGGLHQSDDSSMQSFDRDFSNAETESPNSCLSPTIKVTCDPQFDPDLVSNEPQHSRGGATNPDERIRVRKSPQKNDSQESEDSTSSLASNSSTTPVPPPRRNRHNYLVSKYKSMPVIDKMVPPLSMKKVSSSQSENDLLNCTPNLPRDNQSFSGYPHKKLRSVQVNKKALNSQIMTAERQLPNCSTMEPRDEPGEQNSFSNDLLLISRKSNHEEFPDGDQSRIDRKNLGRVLFSNATDEIEKQVLFQHHLQHPQEQQQQQQQWQQLQNDRRPLHSERKHLPLAPQNSYPFTYQTEMQTEKEIRLALFQKQVDPYSMKKSSEEPFPRPSKDLPQMKLHLSSPPRVLLQNIGPPLIAAKSKQNSTKPGRNLSYDEELGTGFTNSKKSVGSEQVPSNYKRQDRSEKHALLKKAPDIDTKETLSSSPHPIASEVVLRRPKHPPSYEEATNRKYRQHQRSSFAENLYKESLKEFDQDSNEEYVKIPQAKKSAPNHSDPKLDKPYKKDIVNNNNDVTSLKLVQCQYQDSSKKNRRKSVVSSDIAPSNRLQRHLSRSESNLNFLCNNNGSKTARYQQAVWCKSKPRTESYTAPPRRSLEKRTEIKEEQGKGHRNGSNSNCVLHKSVVKTQSVDLGANHERTVRSSNRRVKGPVLPWSVTEMIGKFATTNDEPPYLHNQFK